MSLERDAAKLDRLLGAQPSERLAALRTLARNAAALLDAAASQFPDGAESEPLAAATEDVVISVVMALAKSKLMPGGGKRLGERIRSILATSPALAAVAGDLLGRLG